MKINFWDRLANCFIAILRPLLRFLVRKEFKYECRGDVSDKKEGFLLIGNHVNTWDAFTLSYNVKKKIRFVASEIAFLDFGKRLGMGFLARTIRKRVGLKDIRVVKKVLIYLKHDYVVGVFPEGDDTFYGETIDVYKTTGKLIKKGNKDVVLAFQSGGHLSHPRWADYHSKKGHLFVELKTLLTKEEISNLSALEVQDSVEKAVYHNEYEWQREKMIPYDRKKRAEGIERLLYYCNSCKGILTIKGINDDIVCSTCGTIGSINQFGFIENNQIDNLVDYNHFQYKNIKEVISSEFEFNVTLNKVDLNKMKSKKLGSFLLKYQDRKLTLTNDKDNYVFDIEKIKYPTNTMKDSFSFDYEDLTYNFTNVRNQFVLYELFRHINGSYKR